MLLFGLFDPTLQPTVGEGVALRELQVACLRIVDVRGIMGRACAKQWGAHVQSNGLRMCKAMACACAKQKR